MSNAYSYQPNNPAPQKSGGGALKIILIIVGILLVLCCGGVVLTGFFGYSMFNMGMTELAKQAVASSPDAQTAIGEVQSAKMNIEAGQKAGGEMALDVQGSAGSGQIIMYKDKAELRMSDGRVIPIEKIDAGDEPDFQMPDLNAPPSGTDATTEPQPATP